MAGPKPVLTEVLRGTVLMITQKGVSTWGLGAQRRVPCRTDGRNKSYPEEEGRTVCSRHREQAALGFGRG